MYLSFNSLPNNKALADDKTDVTQFFFFLRQVENISGKNRKCYLPAFSPFPKMFSKPPSSGSLKFGIVW